MQTVQLVIFYLYLMLHVPKHLLRWGEKSFLVGIKQSVDTVFGHVSRMAG